MPQSYSERQTEIRHLCNEPRCINPDHLQMGSKSQNNFDDKIENGTLRQGEQHYNASTSEQTARTILASKGEGTQKQRAKEFGVSLNIVKDIDCGKSWASLTGNTTVSQRAVKARKLRMKANNKVWTPDMYRQAKIRLQKNVTICDNKFMGSPCHLWQGKPDNGYGRISVFGKLKGAHVLACEVKAMRALNADEVTRHLCGERLCCNPVHLQFGSAKENAVDSLRHATSSLAKLTEDQVRQIKQRLSIDDRDTYVKIGKDFDVGWSTISSIHREKTWAHVS